MELIEVMRLLRRRWLALLPGIPLALLAGLSMLYHVSPSSPHLTSRETRGGVALGETLLTTHSAPTAALDNGMDATLANRAQMLGDLLSTDAQRAEIARQAGVPANLLEVLGPAAVTPAFPVPIATEAITAGLTPRVPYRVVLSTTQSPPLIYIQAAAAKPAQAAKLVTAARQTIQSDLAKSADSRVRLTSSDLGPVQAGLIVRQPSKPVGLLAALLTFVFWASAVVVVAGSLSRLRRPSQEIAPAV